jgi:hypothetical protein
MSKLGRDTALTEGASPANVEEHEILTGSRPDGTAFPASAHRTCGNWTSRGDGSAQVGYFDRAGPGENPNSWNSARATDGCSEGGFAYFWKQRSLLLLRHRLIGLVILERLRPKLLVRIISGVGYFDDQERMFHAHVATIAGCGHLTVGSGELRGIAGFDCSID